MVLTSCFSMIRSILLQVCHQAYFILDMIKTFHLRKYLVWRKSLDTYSNTALGWYKDIQKSTRAIWSDPQMKVQMYPAVLRISCVCETDTGLVTNIHLIAESELPLILKQLMTSTVKCHYHRMIQHLSQQLLPTFLFSHIPGYVTSR